MIIFGLIFSTILIATGGAAAWYWLTADSRAYKKTQAYKDEQQRQRIERIEERELRKHKLAVLRTAREIRKRVLLSLIRQRHVWVYERRGTRVRMSKPQIWTILFTLDEVWLRIDKLPHGVLWTDLLDDVVLENLRIDIGRKDAKWVTHDRLGVFLRVYLRSSIAGIPELFLWSSADSTQTAIELCPKTKPLAIPMGIGENRMFYYIELDKLRDGGPHLLIAGSTGGGKSNMLNQILCTLLTKNQPDYLQFAMIDLKRVELSQYRTIPHLWRPIVRYEQDVSGLFRELKQELENRYDLFERAGVNKIQAWNQIKRPRLPYIILVIDEWANVMEVKALREEAETLLSNLTRLGRAAGIHVIICTQRPSVDVVTGAIKTNVTARIAFRTADNAGSRVILDNGMASDLESVPGRAVWMNGGSYTQIQTPFITDKQIKEAVATVALPEGEAATKEGQEAIMADRVFAAAVNEFGGKFSWRPLYDHFGGTIPQHIIKKLQKLYQYDHEQRGPVIHVAGERYILAQVDDGLPGTKPKYLIHLNGNDPPDRMEAIQAIHDHNQLG